MDPQPQDEPSWEESYRDLGVETFGPPGSEIVEVAGRMSAGDTVLDVGCGDGRNALYLASVGLMGDAFDTSEHGIRKLTELARRRALNVNAWIDDVLTFRPRRMYHLIVCYGVLNFVDRDRWPDIIRLFKTITLPSGRNSLAAFTDEVPLLDEDAPLIRGLLRSGELRDWYADWEIENKKS